MRNLGWYLVAIAIVFMCALYIDAPKTTNFLGMNVQAKKGLDLAGGARLLLCAPKNAHPSGSDMDTARDVIASRAAGGIGVVEPQVSRVGSSCINVEMPGLKKQSEVIRQIGQTGYLALTDSGTQSVPAGTKVKLVCKDPGCGASKKVGNTDLTAKPPVMQVVVAGKYVKRGSAQAGYDPQSNTPLVNYTLEGRGNDNWCTFTTAHVQGYSAIVLDNKVVSDPQIQGAICGGQTQITGITSIDEARTIATYLNYGALPVKLHVDSSEQVAASLGPQYVDLATRAAVIGLVIVALFMLLYYRLPGLIADLALILYAAVAFAVYKIFGVTFTLAGIAGFILSIGMAVDANVLIFERMREELRSGKSLGAAVEHGFRRAFPSIRDSNASTIITCVILYVFGHNFAATVITGFAITLGVGVLISFLTAVYVSRTFMRALVKSGYGRSAAMYGVEEIAGGSRVA